MRGFIVMMMVWLVVQVMVQTVVPKKLGAKAQYTRPTRAR